MSTFKKWLLGSCAFALVLILTPGVTASEWDQKVVATFSGPVEIPGQVLPAGTYVFKVFDSLSTREIVQVSNSDESRVLALTIAIPQYRAYPTEKAQFIFEERGGDSPQALKAWYYPGYTSGHELIYGARVAPVAETASSTAATTTTSEAPTNQPNVAEESSPVTSANAITSEPAPADEAQSSQNPNQDRANQTQTTPDTSTTTSTPATDQSDKELPKTASSTPLIALIGILLLGGALGLKTLLLRVS